MMGYHDEGISWWWDILVMGYRDDGISWWWDIVMMGYRGLESFGCRQGCCEQGNEPWSAVKYGTSRERLCFMELIIRTRKEKSIFSVWSNKICFKFEPYATFTFTFTFTYSQVVNIITCLQRSQSNCNVQQSGCSNIAGFRFTYLNLYIMANNVKVLGWLQYQWMTVIAQVCIQNGCEVGT